MEFHGHSAGGIWAVEAARAQAIAGEGIKKQLVGADLELSQLPQIPRGAMGDSEPHGRMSSERPMDQKGLNFYQEFQVAS